LVIFEKRLLWETTVGNFAFKIVDKPLQIMIWLLLTAYWKSLSPYIRYIGRYYRSLLRIAQNAPCRFAQH